LTHWLVEYPVQALLLDHPPAPAIPDVSEAVFIPIDRGFVGVIEPAETPPPRLSILQRLARGRGAAFVAFIIALSLHAAAIAAGVYYYKSLNRYQPPQLVLPKGWATEVDGAGDAGALALLQPAAALDLAKPPAEPQEQLNRVPPSQFEPPAVLPPAVVIDSSSGTTDLGPLPALTSIASAAPPVNFRSPPGGSATASEPADAPTAGAAQAGEHRASDAPSSASGAAPTGYGISNGGGPQGVPDGQPIPSTRNKKPAYPEVAQRRGWTGTVQLELDLDDAGRVTAARLLQSCGHDLLDQAALDAARHWTYTPATLNGRPVPVTVPVPIVYGLESRRR
jgi:protein TonB